MICQECNAAEATVTFATLNRSLRTGELEARDNELHLCGICAQEYQRTHGITGRSLGQGQKKITECVRVLSVTPEWTVYRLVRTDSDPVPVDWRLLTDRLPVREVGAEFRMTYAPEELEFLKGEGQFR
jgi:hypothetical protein